MKTEHTINGLREPLRQARREGKTIGFVPTMGNLHAGHISLVERAKAQCDIVVASIFVNPTQFGANEDFGTYPRTLEADSQLLAAAGCDFLFAPAATEMYGNGLNQSTSVHVAELGKELCGAHRPGHFDGVSSVVSKLFNIVQPDTAFFGEKDFQQLAIVRRMTQELNFPITIVGVPTLRAEDGLALSSRNGYLSAAERQQAPMVYRTLCQLRDAIGYGQRDYEMLTEAARQHLQKSGFDPDYVSVRRASDLLPAKAEDTALVILVAARLGKTRLIDNLAFELPASA